MRLLRETLEARWRPPVMGVRAPAWRAETRRFGHCGMVTADCALPGLGPDGREEGRSGRSLRVPAHALSLQEVQNPQPPSPAGLPTRASPEPSPQPPEALSPPIWEGRAFACPGARGMGGVPGPE